MKHSHNLPLLSSLLFIFSSLFLSVSVIKAQRNEILAPNIASLQVIAGDDWTAPLPVIELRGDKRISISFDELSHTYHRYCYKIEHCEADWTTSEELFESDYVDGFSTDNTIDNNDQSVGTNQLYTHYYITIPNEKCRPKMSGNYRVTVYDEDEDNQPILRAYFMIVEPRMNDGLQVSGNTDIDVNKSHQQVSMSLNYGDITVTAPQEQIKTVVMQNGRWDNAIINPKAQYVKSNGLEWSHCRDLIFPAGNEYRKFELLDPTHTTMGLERTGWDGKHYQAWVFTDEPRPSYVYDEDANGAFCIRNSDDVNNDTESDYIMTHFRLRAPRVNGDIFLNGAWTHDSFGPAYRMVYDETDSLYKASVMLKQGYYSYQYLLRTSDGTLHPLPSEGSFYQTENSYQALVYFRPQGGRTDRLVGYGALSTR